MDQAGTNRRHTGFTGDLKNRGAPGYTNPVSVASRGVKFCSNRTGEIALNERMAFLVPLRAPFTPRVSPTPKHRASIMDDLSGSPLPAIRTGAAAPPLSACTALPLGSCAETYVWCSWLFISSPSHLRQAYCRFDVGLIPGSSHDGAILGTGAQGQRPPRIARSFPRAMRCQAGDGQST